VLLAVLTIIGVVLVWAAACSVRARNDITAARRSLAALRTSDEGELANAHDLLREAGRRTSHAADLMDQPGPVLAARIPLLGRSFAAVRATVVSADAVVVSAEDVLTALGDAKLFGDGRVDLKRLATLRDALVRGAERTETPIARLAAARTGWTPRTVKHGVADARRDLGGTAAALADSAELLRTLHNMLGGSGDRTLLIGLQNNAELRATGGLLSYVGFVTMRDGALEFGGFKEVDLLSAPPEEAEQVAAPKEYVDRYGEYLANSTLWKNVNMSPDGPASLTVLAAVAERSLGVRPDSVVLIDVPAVVRILRATGPADLPGGGRLTSSNAAEQLLVAQYEGASDTKGGQAERRRRLRVAADAVVPRLLGGGSKPLPLLRALQKSAASRHVVVWSADPADADALRRSGIDGALPQPGGDIALVSAHNLGSGARGNKLDYYGRRDMRISVVIGAKSVETEQRFVLRNTSPSSGLSAYVAGERTPGTTAHIVSFAVPAGADLLRLDRDGKPVGVSRESEAGHDVLDDVVTIPAGGMAEWVLRYRTPLTDRAYRLHAVPQPLAFDAVLTVDVRGEDGVSLIELSGPGMQWSGDWDRNHVWRIALHKPGWLEQTRDAFRKFWEEPVTIGRVTGPCRARPGRWCAG
jgi:hypothetical protein